MRCVLAIGATNLRVTAAASASKPAKTAKKSTKGGEPALSRKRGARKVSADDDWTPTSAKRAQPQRNARSKRVNYKALLEPQYDDDDDDEGNVDSDVDPEYDPHAEVLDADDVVASDVSAQRKRGSAAAASSFHVNPSKHLPLASNVVRPDEGWQCCVCRTLCRNEPKLALHLESVHRIEFMPYLYRCPKCKDNTELNSQEAFKAHMMRAHCVSKHAIRFDKLAVRYNPQFLQQHNAVKRSVAVPTPPPPAKPAAKASGGRKNGAATIATAQTPQRAARITSPTIDLTELDSAPPPTHQPAILAKKGAKRGSNPPPSTPGTLSVPPPPPLTRAPTAAAVAPGPSKKQIKRVIDGNCAFCRETFQKLNSIFRHCQRVHPNMEHVIRRIASAELF